MHEDTLPPLKISPETPRLLDILYEAQLCLRDETSARTFQASLLRLRYEQSKATASALPKAQHCLIDALALGDGSPAREQAAERLSGQAQALEATATRLAANYDGMMQEMATQGRMAVRNGARSHGRERADELRDALKLLKGVLEHPIGGRNYAVWFDTGWVLWKLGEPLTEAEDAFYQASRLSNNERDAFHRNALRHLAHLQAQQDKPEEAYATSQRALALESDDPEVLLETARFAARTGRHAEAARLVEQAVERDIEALIAVLAEPDLATLQAEALARAERQVSAAQAAAERQIARWRAAAEAADKASEAIQAPIEIPDELLSGRESASAAGLGLAEARTLEQQASRQAQALYETILRAVEAALLATRESLQRQKKQIDRMNDDKAYWEGSILKLEADARSAGFSLHPYQFENPFTRRKNERARQARDFYQQCRANLTNIEVLIQEQMPTLTADYEKIEARCAEQERLLQTLDAAARES